MLKYVKIEIIYIIPEESSIEKKEFSVQKNKVNKNVTYLATVRNKLEAWLFHILIL
jgi:hypothetical protein